MTGNTEGINDTQKVFLKIVGKNASYGDVYMSEKIINPHQQSDNGKDIQLICCSKK